MKVIRLVSAADFASNPGEYAHCRRKDSKGNFSIDVFFVVASAQVVAHLAEADDIEIDGLGQVWRKVDA